MSIYMTCFWAILKREILRFFHQRSRLFSALVRPLLWLVVFAAGFRSALGISIMPPYESYILYQEYIVPGLCAMIILFNSMQTSLSMVYDREMGSMKVLLMSPISRSFLLFCKLIAAACLSLLQVVIFLLLANLVDVDIPWWGFIYAIPSIFLSAFFLGALGLMLSNFIKQLENFAGVMNFVIFPMFFLSSALYPLWKMQESSLWLYWICQYNPFTYCVEMIRFALYGQTNISASIIIISCVIVSGSLAVASFKPRKI
ncbi:ABC transporter permease [Brumicola pallidula]|jgi:ABC-2 type transport system permease protein|uniref:Transport permease protein n=1 Tax=Brumicola pallidula DSM 14239 = ACAM 615 TaxID=1121922 RepID=K6ZIR3_9ALTE|nr:ABC transporter permease [Glaciecola pallidula]GAC30247.1 antibiotic transport system permease protein [Glaciecola pallidula DSM 14239 = ACAM 615]